MDNSEGQIVAYELWPLVFLEYGHSVAGSYSLSREVGNLFFCLMEKFSILDVGHLKKNCLC